MKSKLSQIGEVVAESSIKAIDKVEKPPLKNSPSNGKGRRVYGPVALLSIIVIGLMLLPSLWPINQVLGSKERVGGTYVEGSVSSLGNLNPIFSSEVAEKTVGRLIFSSLFKQNKDGGVEGDLAESWSANEDSTIFTVKLKPGLSWSDGEVLNADDVLTTYQLIQHPDTESPLRNNWRSVKVTKKDDLTITFALADSYSPFYKNLTNPIVPEHAFEGLPATEIRLSDFSQQPLINSGPFSFKRISEDADQVELTRNKLHHGNKPNIGEFIVRTFSSTQDMLSSYRSGGLSAMAGVDLGDANSNEQLKDVILSDNSFKIPLQTSVFMFMKNSDETFKDLNVRKAISLSIDTAQIATVSNNLVQPLNQPLLPVQHPDGSSSLRQGYDPVEASKLLDKAGWKKDGTTGVRMKGKDSLQFSLHTQNSGLFPGAAKQIASQLSEAGITVTIIESKPSDLQQNNVQLHAYEAILFGFESGSDPDAFALWHSSQAVSSRYNLSEIKDTIIDGTLEAGRTRSDESLRENNYQAFVEQWHAKVPAVPLYQPSYVYVVKDNVRGIVSEPINTPEDRLNSVGQWQIL